MTRRAKATVTSAENERIPLSRVVTASLKRYAATNAEHDRGAGSLHGYVPGPGTLDAVARLDLGMRGGKHGRAISITGPYGSGKSAMAVFLDALYGPDGSAEWKKARRILRAMSPDLASSVSKTRVALGAHKGGLLRCTATAGREPVAATVVRALRDGAGRYFGSGHSFDGTDDLERMLDADKAPSAEAVLSMIRKMCSEAPVLLVIDEFGKNIEYSADEQRGEGDLFLLQAMAEMSGGSEGVPLFIVTLQHVAFEEYAAGASSAQRSEWSKVQGRFDDLPFANSSGQTRRLVAGALEHPGPAYKKEISAWAKKHAAAAREMGLEPDIDEALLSSCYPLHPLVLEVLPDMCSRYGQNERTLLSFVAGGGSHTVARFIGDTSWDKPGELPAARLDLLYDYFVAGSALAHAALSNASRLMEVSTIIRDAHGLSDEESRALKAIGVLNLLGKSGRLRASRGMVTYASGASDAALQSLEEKSIVSYRRHADEYRVWQGSDADIKSALETARKRRADAPLAGMLNEFMPLIPIVAARHSYKTGTFRIFERRFAEPGQGVAAEPTKGHDGAVTYVTGDPGRLRARPRRPVLVAKPSRLEPLREAVIEAASIRDVLDKPEIASDRVARRELYEMLASAESAMNLEFGEAFGDEASWYRVGRPGRPSKNHLGHEASKACDAGYPDAPLVFNEIINRTAPSRQGTGAVNKLLEAMVNKSGEPGLGISGWGPERSIYEALLARTGIHRSEGSASGFHPPNGLVVSLWKHWESMLTEKRRRTAVSDLYAVASEPPFGARAGIMPVLTAALILANQDSMALYEHGTYCPAVTVEALERMAKNPSHFEIKYFGSAESNMPVLARIARELGVAAKPGSGGVTVLDVVGFLVTAVSKLTPHIKNTKALDKDSICVRDTILEAVEPDSLLFESLPAALGFPAMQGGGRELDGFAARLARAVKILESAFDVMVEDLKASLFGGLGAAERKEISKTASGLIRHVSEPRMRAFLNALSADSLDDAEWIKYVAMSLSGAPPADWSDGDRLAFNGNLKDMSGKFADLAALHFASLGAEAGRSVQVTLTRPDGRVKRNVVTLPVKRKESMDRIVDDVIKDMEKNGFEAKDLRAVAALLMLKSGE